MSGIFDAISAVQFVISFISKTWEAGEALPAELNWMRFSFQLLLDLLKKLGDLSKDTSDTIQQLKTEIETLVLKLKQANFRRTHHQVISFLKDALDDESKHLYAEVRFVEKKVNLLYTHLSTLALLTIKDSTRVEWKQLPPN